MKKLKLNLDELKVESFEVSSDPKTRNTVKGYDFNTARTSPCDEPCNETVDYGNTCYDSCNGSCVATCDASCGDTCGYTCDNYTCNGRTCDGVSYTCNNANMCV